MARPKALRLAVDEDLRGEILGEHLGEILCGVELGRGLLLPRAVAAAIGLDLSGAVGR